MTTAEKLRFLADRAEDKQEFCLGDETMKFDSINVMVRKQNGEWIHSDIKFNLIEYYVVKLKPQWEFTEDEKVILRNLPIEYKWIVRDKNKYMLTLYQHIPSKNVEYSEWESNGYSYVIPFNRMFQSIKWTDDEPCEFRKYL